MKLVLMLLFLLSVPVQVFSQELPDTVSGPLKLKEDIIEDFTRRTDTGYDFSDIIYDNTPDNRSVNINKASQQTLKSLDLNEEQIANIRKYIEQNGDITGIYELHLIEGFDSALIMKLSSQLEFKLDPELHKITSKNLIARGQHTILSRYSRVLQRSGGYHLVSDTSTPSFAGNPDKLLFKYSFSYYDRLRFGITMEKDPGESMKGGFDFYSLHFLYRSKGIVKTLALGDYNLTFGQGLSMNNGFSFGSNPANSIIRPLKNRVSSSTGANENSTLRGAAITISPVQRLNMTMFYSSTKLDAGIFRYDPDESVDGYFTSVIETGLHRTTIEIDRKNALQQVVYGSNVNYRTGILRIGATVFQTDYSEPMKAGSELYDKFSFMGKRLVNYGTDFTLTTGWMTFFGEYASSTKGGSAMLAGITAQKSNEYGFSVLYRNYLRNYHNFFSNAYSTGSTCSNETGIYAGFFANITDRFILNANADHYMYPWFKYRTDGPTDGSEYNLQLKYQLSGKNEFSARYTLQRKMINPLSELTISNEVCDDETFGITTITPPVSAIIDYPIETFKHLLRLNLSYSPLKNLILRNRLDVLFNKSSKILQGNGYLVYQDIIYTSDNQPVTVNLRYALFDTKGYNERIYAYESDVLYSFSVPSYYYKGSRFYVMLNYSIDRKISVWIRYAQSYYPGRNSTGTGVDEIQGNRRSELKIQFILKF